MQNIRQKHTTDVIVQADDFTFEVEQPEPTLQTEVDSSEGLAIEENKENLPGWDDFDEVTTKSSEQRFDQPQSKEVISALAVDTGCQTTDSLLYLRCKNCMQLFDRDHRSPRLLKCGETLCLECVWSIYYA